MSSNSKIFIASKTVVQITLPYQTTPAFERNHLYLVIDGNGDPNTYIDPISGQTLLGTNDERVIRGGPLHEEDGALVVLNNIALGTETIKLEIDASLDQSFDRFDPTKPSEGLTPAARNYTYLIIPVGTTVDAVWNDLKAAATSLQNGTSIDRNNRPITSVPYNPLVGFNSNSTITTVLSMVGINIFQNIPGYQPPSNFTDIERIFVSGSAAQTFTITDSRITTFTDYGTGNTTLNIDVGAMLAGQRDFRLTLKSDSSTSSVDKIILKGVDTTTMSIDKAVRITKVLSGNYVMTFATGAQITLDGSVAGPLAGFNQIDVMGTDGNLVGTEIMIKKYRANYRVANDNDYLCAEYYCSAA